MNSQFWVCKKKLLYMSSRIRKRIFFSFHKKQKWKKNFKNSFILANLNTIFFFHNLKAESSQHICVKFYFSRVCRTHKNFKSFVKMFLKTFFAKFFCFLWFTQNYTYFYTIYGIFTQLSWTEFYLCIFQENYAQIFIWIQNYKKKKFLKIIQIVFSKIKYFI